MSEKSKSDAAPRHIVEKEKGNGHIKPKKVQEATPSSHVRRGPFASQYRIPRAEVDDIEIN